jgi:methionyl-tRNA formyltransferase
MVVPRPGAPVPVPAPVVFFGSPAFAVPTLRALVEAPDCTVPLVVTQPPRPAGRGKAVQRSAVHEAADALGLAVFTPDRLRGADVLAALRAVAPALFVVAAYGKILRPDVLDIPSHGTLNVHASLLPAYRGASPITAAILDGVPVTGVSIMLMDIGLDTGPVLAQDAIPIPPDATTVALTGALAALGAPLLVATTRRWLSGQIAPQPQDDAQATTTRLIRKEDGAVDWQEPAERIARMERAYSPWPGVYSWLGDERLLLHALSVLPSESNHTPGTIVAISPDGMRVTTGAGDVLVGQIQPEGKRPMDARAFAASRHDLVGGRLSGAPPPLPPALRAPAPPLERERGV